MRKLDAPRATILMLGLAVLLAALICLPVAAQEAPATSSSVAAAAQASPSPAPYQPAAVAFATPRPAAAAASSDGPDPDRKWEVEFHGGGLLATSPSSGGVALPDPGVPFATVVGPSRFESSWYFGDGAALYNQFVSAFAAPGLTNTISPLDPALNSEVVHRQHGAAFGGRLYRELSPRWGVELNFDYNLGELEMSDRGLNQIAATSASWQAAFTQMTTFIGATGVTVTSTAAAHRSDGHQALITGGAVLNLKTEGRAIPYLTFGLGVIHNTGDMPFATLVGNYSFTFAGAPFNETDAVGMRYTISDNVVTGYVGAGLKYYVTPHWGIRMDVRDYLSPNTIDNLVDASPSRVLGAPNVAFVFISSPTIQFSNNAALADTLTGPVITGFRTFSSNGVQQQIGISGGIFFRF
ncbi:MAG TPA: hypothetical protein VEG08_07900 [Terriglobales bacterium]|nr:hypothetical protein [Terriglobales bacterium]